jgi:hypothetical protein
MFTDFRTGKRGFVPVAVFVLVGACFAGLNTPVLAQRPAKAKSSAGSSSPAIKPRPGYAVGRVTDGAGKPLAGVEVRISGTTLATGSNASFRTRTDARGMYSQRVPDGIYRVRAEHKTTYNGSNYVFDMHPVNGIITDDLDSSSGIVKNFVWKTSGLLPGQTAGKEGTYDEITKYYGGYITINLASKGRVSNAARVVIPAKATLTLTLTPRGPRVDGSSGTPLTFKRTFAEQIDDSLGSNLSSVAYLTDIPVGVYTARASLLLQNGTTVSAPLQRSTKGVSEVFTPTVELPFTPFGEGGSTYPEHITIEL